MLKVLTRGRAVDEHGKMQRLPQKSERCIAKEAHFAASTNLQCYGSHEEGISKRGEEAKRNHRLGCKSRRTRVECSTRETRTGLSSITPDVEAQPSACGFCFSFFSASDPANTACISAYPPCPWRRWTKKTLQLHQRLRLCFSFLFRMTVTPLIQSEAVLDHGYPSLDPKIDSLAESDARACRQQSVSPPGLVVVSGHSSMPCQRDDASSTTSELGYPKPPEIVADEVSHAMPANLLALMQRRVT
ncbi:hypothetical protein GGR52DRAFT_30577 [Hypoxylon sp. FL1284]|nr:hypothetical protein GGR52DRAFT_30577 [Hypoxylon sp. FL1284]